MKEFRLAPKPLSKETIQKYLASLTDEEMEELMKEVEKIKSDNKLINK